MAKIETVKLTANRSETTEIINLMASVGANAVNYKEDVMVVQALLKYALEPVPYFRDAALPEPNGTLNRATAQLIKKYQRYNNRNKNNTRVATDGRLDPVKGGVYAPGTKTLRTILVLQTDALKVARLAGQSSLPEALFRRWSFLRGILNKGGVGGLGLSLEPSAPRVGSLGLPLS